MLIGLVIDAEVIQHLLDLSLELESYRGHGHTFMVVMCDKQAHLLQRRGESGVMVYPIDEDEEIPWPLSLRVESCDDIIYLLKELPKAWETTTGPSTLVCRGAKAVAKLVDHLLVFQARNFLGSRIMEQEIGGACSVSIKTVQELGRRLLLSRGVQTESVMIIDPPSLEDEVIWVTSKSSRASAARSPLHLHRVRAERGPAICA